MLIHDAGKIDLNRYIEEMRQSGSEKNQFLRDTVFDILFDIPEFRYPVRYPVLLKRYCPNSSIPLALIGLHCRCKLCQRFFILYQNIIPFTAVLSFDISSKGIKVVPTMTTMMIKNRLTEDTFCGLHFGRRYPWCHRTFI